MRQTQVPPIAPPIAKVKAASWNGGTWPDATVNSASSDHIRIAAKPNKVARCEDMKTADNGTEPIADPPLRHNGGGLCGPNTTDSHLPDRMC